MFKRYSKMEQILKNKNCLVKTTAKCVRCGRPIMAKHLAKEGVFVINNLCNNCGGDY